MSTTNVTALVLQLTAQVQQQNVTITALQSSLDSFFLWINGIFIFFMGAGFAFLEAGAIGSKNVVHTLLINFADVGICILAYWCIGFPFAYGSGGPFIGSDYYASYDIPADSSLYAYFFFQLTFAMTACAIPSGSTLERIEFAPFALYTVLMGGFIYPVITHWAWSSTGWLATGLTITTAANTTLTVTYIDFAGSGVVHVCGGSAALIASFMLRPRKRAIDPITGKLRTLPYHNLPLVMIGCMILMFGFFAFNGASLGHVSQAGDGQTSGLVITNTAICGASASVTTMILARLKYGGNGHWSAMKAMNGFLVGQVAICSGCSSVWPYGAFCIGVVAAFVYMTYTILVPKAGIDDPVEAISVHFGGGSTGVILTAFFNRNPQYGVLLGGTGYSIAWQLVGVLAIAGFTIACSAIYFGVCMGFRIYRVKEIEEERGLDWPTSGELAYPFDAFHEGWVVKVDEKGKYKTVDKPNELESEGAQPIRLNGTGPIYAPYYTTPFGAVVNPSFTPSEPNIPLATVNGGSMMPNGNGAYLPRVPVSHNGSESHFH